MAITATSSFILSSGNKTAQTATTLTSHSTLGNAAVGDLIVLILASDNAGASGAGTFSSVDQPSTGAVTWSTAINVTRTAGSASNDGATLTVVVGEVTSAVSNSSTIQVNWSASTTAKAWQAYVIAGADPAWVNVATSSGSGTGPTVTTGSSPTRATEDTDLVLGAVAVESNTSTTAEDSDTTNGNWGTLNQGSSGGGGGDATKMSVDSQWKIVNANGNQTYNPTITNTDYVIGIITFAEVATGPATIEGTGSASLGGTFSGTAVITHEATASGSLGGAASASAVVTHQATASAAGGFTADATGTASPPPVEGTASASLGGTASATAVVTHQASASASLGGTGTATGDLTHPASLAATLGGTAAATGVVTHEATAAASGGFSASATADVTTPGSTVEGTASAAISFFGLVPDTGAIVTKVATGSASLGGTASASATVTHEASAAAALGATASASAGVTHQATADSDLTFTADATGTVIPEQIEATASLFNPFFALVPETGAIVTKHATGTASLGGTAIATAVLTKHATADAPLTFSADATGTVESPGGTEEGVGDAQLGFTASATAIVVHEATAGDLVGFTATAGATRIIEGTADASITLEAKYEHSPEKHEARSHLDLGGLTASATGTIIHEAIAIARFTSFEAHMQGPGPRRRTRGMTLLESRTLPSVGLRDPNHLTKIQRRTRGV